ncbi:MAG: HD domain-containing phosphohydrolase [Thermincola sp.]|jgi:putative nucleotidyltransferase with HDIG domain|nr:HD domain-containing phosphohydrolase [Thermincola sp.]MDT3702482.1 HD domain-containing phosphohydrolase [Thermincola sp.]
MSGHIANEDIYDRNGILLLSKGQEITDAVMAKLTKLGSYSPTKEQANFTVKQSVTFPTSQSLGEIVSIRGYRVSRNPNNILNTIVFESKSKPWWIYVNTLGNYIDWLYTHSIDVAIISLMIAEELGYTEKELWNLGLGAFLHDVGKLLIPKPILQKPGPLNNAEMAFMRQHCEIGMSSLESLSLPKECTDIVLQHHERLDGSGYPNGLKEDEICRSAKIVMIADAVDAITSGRPYKQTQDLDAAIRILRSDEEKYTEEFISVLERLLIL